MTRQLHYNESVRIAVSVNADDPWIDGHEYIGCNIDGPALLIIGDKVDLKSNTIHGKVDAVLWTLKEGRLVIGGIGVRNTSFTNCVFDGIGFAATERTLRKLRLDLSRTAREAESNELPWWQRIQRGKR